MEAFSVTCVITAKQGPGVSASSQLLVSVHKTFSYGSAPLIFIGAATFSPIPSSQGFDSYHYRLKDCLPHMPGLQVNSETGELSWNEASTSAGVTGIFDGQNATPIAGGKCSVIREDAPVITGTDNDSPTDVADAVEIIVLKPNTWNSLDYGFYGPCLSFARMVTNIQQTVT